MTRCRRGHDCEQPPGLDTQGRCRACQRVNNLKAVNRYRTTVSGFLTRVREDASKRQTGVN
jgi:hypothetical protein